MNEWVDLLVVTLTMIEGFLIAVAVWGLVEKSRKRGR